jgi:hypothetical protein
MAESVDATDLKSVGFITVGVQVPLSPTKKESTGKVSEWFKEHAWKACVGNTTQGSNPCLSEFMVNTILLLVIFITNNNKKYYSLRE